MGNVAPTTRTGIAKLYNVPLSQVEIDTKGNITIVRGKKHKKLTSKDIERRYEVDNLVNKERYSTNPKDQKKFKEQATVAKPKISDNGIVVSYHINAGQSINAEEFKKLFNLKDGALRSALRQAHDEGLQNGDVRVLSGPAGDCTTVGTRTEYSDGLVTTVIDDAGHIMYDYTGMSLEGGKDYAVSSDYLIGKKSEGLFGWGFLGL